MNQIENALITVGGDVVHHFVGGVYAKETHIPAGTQLGQHKHDHDHLSILAKGTVVVGVNGQAGTFSAPCAIRIAAGTEHHVLALTDAVWFCIWPEALKESGGGHVG